ncbi:MAG: hypothetical protein ACLFVY_09285 [Phycisphaerae bacterium]
MNDPSAFLLKVADAVPVSAPQHVEDANGANRTLIEAIAKGHRRQAQLESDDCASLEDLTKNVGWSHRSRQAKMGCDRTYVGRMLRLTSLAPDITEAILRGIEPVGRWNDESQTTAGCSADHRKRQPTTHCC